MQGDPSKAAMERAEALVDIIEEAGRGYSIRLTKLVDGEATYELTYRGKVTGHESHDDACDALREMARAEKIKAAVAALTAAGYTITKDEK